jgi:hypothetical protein
VSNHGGARWVGGGAVLGLSGDTAALGHRGELREAVAAEEERERELRLRRLGRSSACGSFAQRNFCSSRVVATRPDPILAKLLEGRGGSAAGSGPCERGRGSPRRGGAGPQAVAE